MAAAVDGIAPKATSQWPTQAHRHEKLPDFTHNGRPMAKRHRQKVKEESLIASFCTFVCDHQLGISINLILLLFLTHVCFPRARPTTSKFFHLSYQNPNSNLYGLGTDDLYFVLLYVVICCGVRVAIMDYILAPLATWGAIKNRKTKVRFVEQAWLVVYYTPFFLLGLYIMYHSEYWLNLKALWTNWPTRQVTGLVKWYYLVQFAFWIQQMLVVNIEEKRKDYTQMFVHHIITSVLMFLSYGSYQTRVGNVILCLMDSVDILLSTAKCLKYLGCTTICDVVFGMFMASWLVTRHILYLMVCWSIYADIPKIIPSGCYVPSESSNATYISMYDDPVGYEKAGGTIAWRNVLHNYIHPQGPVCWNPTIQYCFLGLLLTLHCIILLWFAMIFRVAYKVVSGASADDVRSDDEDEEEEEEVDDEADGFGEAKPLTAAPFEEEVGVESLSFTRRSSPSLVSRGYRRGRGSGGPGRASGISIPGHGDHKELLGRIGCDKPT